MGRAMQGYDEGFSRHLLRNEELKRNLETKTFNRPKNHILIYLISLTSDGCSLEQKNRELITNVSAPRREISGNDH